jgi:hypothetical protein
VQAVASAHESVSRVIYINNTPICRGENQTKASTCHHASQQFRKRPVLAKEIADKKGTFNMGRDHLHSFDSDESSERISHDIPRRSRECIPDGLDLVFLAAEWPDLIPGAHFD